MAWQFCWTRAMMAWVLFCGVVPSPMPSAAETPSPRMTIPADQPPLLRTWPPRADERAPRGTEKVVVFSREKIGNESQWDFIAGAWEFIPSQPNKKIVKRAEFSHSSWNAGLLVDGATGEAARFIRLQVDRPSTTDYYVNVYRIDFSSWDVTVAARGQPPYFTAFGAGGGLIYLNTADGLRLLDQRSCKIEKPSVAWELLARVSQDAWLVRKTGGDRDDAFLFDPDHNAFGLRTRFPESEHVRTESCRLSPSKRFLVSILQPPDDATGFPRDAEMNIVAHDLQKGASQAYPIHVYVANGSGVRFIFFFFNHWFSGENEITIQSGIPSPAAAGKGVVVTETTIELLTGHRRDAKIATMRVPPDRRAERYSPAFLGQIKMITGDEHQDLALAFLKHKGIALAGAKYSGMMVKAVYSPDGKRLFLRTGEGIAPDSFYYGDLQKDTLIRIEPPPELRRDNALNLEWVSS